jgi:hypothetical protein
MKKLLYLTAMLLACVVTSYAQPRIPGASTTQTIIQDLGLGKVTITYSRPNVKDRKIFGGLQPYGEVWRTGANSATTIEFSEDVIIEGNKVPAGKYGLFTIPGKDEWTIIINKTWKQWGAYEYKQADDLLRFTVKPITTDELFETFAIVFMDVTTRGAELDLLWEKTVVPIRIKSDDDAKIMANIDTLMSSDKKANYYFTAIQYYYENDKDMNKALQWALAGEATDPKAPYYVVWEARVRLKMGDKEGAIKAAERGVQLSKDAKDEEYERLNQMVIDKAKK